ncbi:hypothetical protein GF325_08415 [Candidatus Bathyarchaeota archaeon]|nr:hypothetical protein [Candidatus Bathyarchaeota archaeon]
MEPLAMDGGSKAISLDQDELLQWPKMGVEEERAVLELLRNGEISQSEIGKTLAAEFKQFIGAKHALPKVNGTACLLSAFFALGIGKGDEVIAPTNTYWATVMPAAFLGAKIVFCESDPTTLCIDPADIRKKVTEKTKAIVPVHIYGYPCEMDEISEIAEERGGIPIIEDASHAHGAEYKGSKVGTLGTCAIFSLQGSKVIPAGEAGILVTNDIDIHERAMALGHYEMLQDLDRDAFKKYRRTGLGLKHRISPLHAAIALCQLRKFPEINGRITRNCETFLNGIEEIEGTGFEIPPRPSYIKRTYFMNQVLYREGAGIIPREDLTFLLGSEGLRVGQSRYEMLHKQPYFLERGYSASDLQFTDDLCGRLVSFPNFPWDESGELVQQYIHGIEKVAYHTRDDFT